MLPFLLLATLGSAGLVNVTDWGTATMAFQKWESHSLVFNRRQSAVIFHNFANTFLTVQVNNSDGSLKALRSAGFGTTFYGFDYGKSTGQISIAANKQTYITYSTIVFPNECNSSNRYISTRSEEFFSSDYEPNDPNTHHQCIWYVTDGTYEISVSYDTSNGFLVCEENVNNCTNLTGHGTYTRRMFEGSFYAFDRRHGTFNMSIKRTSKLATKMIEAKTLIDPVLDYSFIHAFIQNEKIWMGAILAGCIAIGALIIITDILITRYKCRSISSFRALKPGADVDP